MKLSTLFGIFLVLSLAANETLSAPSESSLFEQKSLLNLSMKVDFDQLCRPRETPDCEYVPTEMVYFDGTEKKAIPVQIRIRGGWRAIKSNCTIPLLFIRFTDEGTEGTPFEGQSTLPLTTHCGRATFLGNQTTSSPYSNYEQYLLKEYLAYRMYEDLTDTSLRVRLARIRYDKPGKSRRGRAYHAFFTEHFKSLAQREQAELLMEKGSFDYEVLDREAADTVALFQFMIGNTDWSIARQRNTILLRKEDGTQVPVPFDFDMSGLVNAPYAGPPPSLPIKDVTDRYYLGYCHPGIQWDVLFDQFLSRQGVLMSHIEEVGGLYRREQESIQRFMGKFFAILGNPTRRSRAIIEACQAWPPTTMDHMSPEKLGR